MADKKPELELDAFAVGKEGITEGVITEGVIAEAQTVALPLSDSEDLNRPPDGGLHAWMAVAAVWLISFVTFGIATIWGVFQDAYVIDPTSRFHSTTAFRLGFVGGCAAGFTSALGPIANILVGKFGIHAPMIVGIVMVSVSFELASISTQYWQLLMSQGIMFGFGASIAYIPAISLPSQYFAKKRSLATGIASSGSGVGAVVLSPVVQALIDNVSIPWALRFLGFFSLVVGLAGVSLVRQRPAAKKKTQYKLLDLSVLRVPLFPMFLLFAFVQFFGFITPILLIPNYCTAIGLSVTNGSAVLSVTTAVQAVGRIIFGLLADRTGPINMLFMLYFAMGLMCMVIWWFANSLGIMMVFAVFWGFPCGAFWSLAVPASAKIVGLEKLASAVSLQFLVTAIPSIFSVPIASSIISATATRYGVSIDSREAYKYLIVWCAVTAFAASLILVPVRMHFSRLLIAKV